MLTISGKTKRIKLRGGDMRIALINENSQGAKNGMIYNSLKKVADQYGFEVDNYGMYTAEDEAQLTYVQAGILAAAILNGKAADYVPKKLLARWRNHFPLFLWNSLSLKGRSRL